MSGVREASAMATLAAISVVDADSDLQIVSSGQVRNAAGQLKTFFSAFSASASPESARGYGNSSSTVGVATPPFTTTPSGGVAPYTYLWTRTDADPQVWNISDSTAATVVFSSDVDPGGNVSATFICTVTDSTGATAATGEVTAHAVNLGGGL